MLLPHRIAVHRLRRGAHCPLTTHTSVLALSTNASLPPVERTALELLVDLSAVLRFEGVGDVLRLEVVGEPADLSVGQLRARNWTIVVGDGRVTIERSLLRFVANVACGVIEQRSSAADKFGRVPAVETLPVRGGFEREAVVSVAARALAAAVRDGAGRRPARFIDPWPDGRRWAAALTHDLDVVEWWPAFTTLRLAELARHGEVARAGQVALHALGSVGRQVVWRAASQILSIEAAHAVRSTWFVLCGTPTLATARAGDLTYRPESPQARRIIDAVREGGHEIGLHGSFATSEDHALFAEQRARLRALVGTSPDGVRQHYLRQRPDTTPPAMALAGFRYDSTAGFPDRNGFRVGVADVIPLWNAARDTALPLQEAPFTWMDRAMSKYQHVESPDAWIEDGLALADHCRAVEGLWVGIWHPNLVPALGFPGAPAAYARLVRELVERDAFIAPLGDIVSWRVARRAIRAVAIGADGTPQLSSDQASPHTFTLRDQRGRADASRAVR